ncbi:ubiquitin conjugation factor E4 A-like [Dysidea avara]|uniref:ubiquitin conjugation factor E4 A-like n=2 Tax=Dysidea avara TaxID=196820 RepID=UPI0033288E60
MSVARYAYNVYVVSGVVPHDTPNSIHIHLVVNRENSCEGNATHLTLLSYYIVALRSDLNRSIDNDTIGEDRKSVLKSFRMLYVLTWDCCLTDPHFVRTCSEFYITLAVWLMMQLQKEDQQSSSANPEAKHVMACIPEYSIKDMVGWFRFVAGNHPRLLSGLELTPFVDCCVTLLQRQDILTGPVAQSKVVSVLLSFTEGSNQASNKSILSGSGWGSGVHGHLASLVHTNPMVQEHLGPALMSTYIAVDQIEGLDVDKEDFDKYQARYGITRLVEQLWRRADCRASILKQCRSKRFQSFLGAVFDTLLYQLTDSLHRLGNVKKIEVAQEDKEHWNQLSPRQRAEKERFVAGEKRVTKGFMSMGTTLLDLLNQMVECGEVAACFCIVPLSSRVAAAIFGFLNLLCGPKASELKVKDMDKYSFQPYALLTQLVNILLMICRQEPQPRARDGFVSSLALHPDYDRVTMDKVVSVIQRKGSLSDDVVTQLTSLIEEVETIQAKERENDEAALESAEPLQASSGGGAKFGGLPPWQQEAESCVISKDDLNSIYVEALKESQYDCSEISESHALESHAVQTLDPRSSKTKALMKEMESLPEMLPLHIDSSVFILQDEDRMDLVRAIVTGPADTPYSKGCFVFDIYFPATYPAVPPLVKLITTGNGTIRFNPNLYADGKVCLSLLGTWHGGDATEKWNPQNSTLFQVLVSIQGLILIKDPMFKEPSYERIQGTEEGNAKSAEYNSDLHVHTVRYAMLEQLRNPPAGCEDIIKVHFTIQRDAVLKQCSEWLRQAVSTDQERRLRKAVDELRVQLDKIQ